MRADLIWSNVLVYSGQIGVVALAAALISSLLRLRAPAAKLLYWQTVIGACLLLPLLRPWRTESAGAAVTISTSVIGVAAPRPPSGWHAPSLPAVMLFVIAAGIGIRLAWLAVGLVRLRKYRMHSRPIESGAHWADAHWVGEAELRISVDVTSPVTFGYRDPVILLPARFAELDTEMQRAIVCHELTHVLRCDWLWTLAEEFVRAVLWFHPAVWWMLGEAQLAREQTVDRVVIEMTGARDRYLDALLAIAGTPARLDLAPAPLFLKRRHLKQRVISIVKEVRVSKTRLVSTFAASAAMLAGVCWMITGALPLTAAPQNVEDAPGVTVQTGGPALMHRSPVSYPEDARAKGVQGTVVVQAKLGADGSVVDASVVSGPEELRKAALQSVLEWHFDRAAGGTTQQVTIDFALPAQPSPAQVSGSVRIPTKVVMVQEPKVVREVEVSGLSDQASQELQAQLPVHAGDKMALSDAGKLTAAVRSFDSHLMVSIADSPTGLTIRIRPQSTGGMLGALSPYAPPPPPIPGPAGSPSAIRVGGNVAQANLVTQVAPAYPVAAKQARVQGTVRMQARIGADGYVKNLELISGPPPLVDAAMDAVRQWVYKPTLLNGKPIDVITTIDVNFTLAQ